MCRMGERRKRRRLWRRRRSRRCLQLRVLLHRRRKRTDAVGGHEPRQQFHDLLPGRSTVNYEAHKPQSAKIKGRLAQPSWSLSTGNLRHRKRKAVLQGAVSTARCYLCDDDGRKRAHDEAHGPKRRCSHRKPHARERHEVGPRRQLPLAAATTTAAAAAAAAAVSAAAAAAAAIGCGGGGGGGGGCPAGGGLEGCSGGASALWRRCGEGPHPEPPNLLGS